MYVCVCAYVHVLVCTYIHGVHTCVLVHVHATTMWSDVVLSSDCDYEPTVSRTTGWSRCTQSSSVTVHVVVPCSTCTVHVCTYTCIM